MTKTLKRFIYDVGWSFASIAAAAFLSFILRIFLARYFGAADIGLYTLAFTVYSFGLIFSGFGIGNGLSKYIAEHRDNADYIKSLNNSGLIISLVTGILAGLILFVFSSFISNNIFHLNELTQPLQIISLAFPFIAIQKAVLGYLNGLRKMRVYTLINIIQNVFILVLTVIFAIAGFDITFAIIGLVIPIILISCWSIFFIRHDYAKFEWGKYKPELRLLFIFGIFVVLANGIYLVQSQANSLIVGYYMTKLDVGLFGVATMIVIAIGLPANAIQLISGPMIAGSWGKRDIPRIEHVINNCMKYSAIYAVLAIFIIFFFSRKILGNIFGYEFVAVSLPLQIMLIGTFFSTIQASVGSALSSTAYVKRIFIITATTTLVSLALNFLLIPRLGLLGAAWGAAITMMISAIVLLYFTQSLIKFRIDWLWFIKLILFSGIIYGCNYFVSTTINLYLSTTVFFIILVAVMFLVFVSANDRKIIMSLLFHKTSR